MIGLRTLAAGSAAIAALVQTGLLEKSVAFTVLNYVQENLVACAVLFVSLIALFWRSSAPAEVLLRDFVTFQADDSLKCDKERYLTGSRAIGCFDEQQLQFLDKILDTNGLGDDTYFPPAMFKFTFTMAAAREEAAMVLFGVMDRLIARTGVDPKQIDILITNCSLFCPTPSLSAMIMNKYGMRSDCLNYNLGGMGCSAGIVAIDLAKRLLNERPNSIAVVCSTENITLNWYLGKDKSMLLPNTLFRVGGAAIMLTNKPGDRRKCRYRLVHSMRTTMASDEDAYKCVYQEPDPEGIIGVRLDRKLMKIAASTLTKHITRLGPIVLPWSEKIKYALSFVRRKLYYTPLRSIVCRGLDKAPAMYVPDFTKAFRHFCIHAGGRAVIDEMEKSLSLKPEHVLPSRATLYRWGNVSSASVWYELAFSEKFNLVKKGERVWQIAFGSGFKVNSAVWEALRDVDGSTWDYLDFSYDPERLTPTPSSQTTEAERKQKAEAASTSQQGSKPEIAGKLDFPNQVMSEAPKRVLQGDQKW